MTAAHTALFVTQLYGALGPDGSEAAPIHSVSEASERQWVCVT